MPRLTRLELQGYKSFANKSEFLFGEGVTCIVGPNGSGKSNIADALRWVLGEQSFSALRGRKTDDMIWSGSEKRARAGMATVAVVFDNSDGWLPVDFSEVSIGRRAYRDSQNEYLLNGQKTRLREISNLLATVGLARRTYTVMGQGLVDAALSLRAEERRSLFEEAAGIGAYRHKREETLRRLDQTQRNLERVQDIVAEIGPRLRSLERQARKTEQHEQIRTDLRALLRVWYGYHWHALQREVAAARAQSDEQAAELQALQADQARGDSALADLRARSAAQRAQRDGWRDDLAQLQSEYEALQRESAVAAERIRNLEERREIDQAELAELEGKLAEAEQHIEAAQAGVTRLEGERRAAAQRLDELEARRRASESERDTLTELIRQTQSQATSLAQQITEQHARRDAAHAERARLEAEHKALGETIAAADVAVESQRTETAARETAAAQTSEASASIDRGTASVREQIAARAADLAAAADECAAAAADVERLQARLEILQQEHTTLDGAASGRQLLQSAAKSGRLAGQRGSLIELLQIDQQHETAIAAALGGALQTLLVDDYGAVNAARTVLADRGRATLAPLAGGRTPTRPQIDLRDPGVLGIAADLVVCPPEFGPVVERLLGRVVVCRTREVAHAVAESLPLDGAAVSLDGEVHHADGRVVIGASSESRALALARELEALPGRLEEASAKRAGAELRRDQITRERDDLQAELSRLSEQRTAAQRAAQEAAAARDAARLSFERETAGLDLHRNRLESVTARLRELDEQSQEFETQVARLAQAHAVAHHQAQTLIGQRADLASPELAEQVAAERTALAVAEHAEETARARMTEVQAAAAQERKSLQERRERSAARSRETNALQEAIEALALRAQDHERRLSELRTRLEPTDRQLRDLEAELARTEAGETRARSTLHGAEQRHLEARLRYESKRGELETLKQRIEDDFGLVDLEFGADMTGQTPLPLAGQVVRLEPVAELPPDIEPEINRYRAQMRRMGAINPEAVREHAEVKERYEHLTEQIGDLEAAAEQLREVVAELDVLMEHEFRKTFDAVAREFRDTFTQLFDGGQAQLQLTNPEDLTATGIDIVAQLPGKREQGLALLSGGERSLTASALIFALLRVSPTPFALLDEVDAMLDEANVGRFGGLLRELSQQTQFIIITHNRHTVEVADTVYGISMGADGVSQMMSLKLDGDSVVKPLPALA